MLNGEVVVSTLKELIRKADSTDKRLGLLEAGEAAHRRMICGGEFPSEAVGAALVIGLRTHKPRLSEACLTCLHHVLQVRAIPPEAVFCAPAVAAGALHNATRPAKDAAPQLPDSRRSPLVNEVVAVLCETLAQVADGSVQLRALDCLSHAMLDTRFTTITGDVLLGVMQACFNASLTCTNVAVQIQSGGVLRTVATQRVVRRFLTETEGAQRVPTFSCGTMLDFAADYDPSDPFVALDVAYLDGSSVRPLLHAHFSDAADTPALGAAARDMCLLLRAMLDLAVIPIPSDVASVQAVEVRTRIAALRLLRLVLGELPPLSTHFEHPAAHAFGEVLRAVKPELWRCIARNVASILPRQLFEFAVEIVSELLIKAHNHLLGELHLLLCTVLLPMVQSRFTTFEQKLAVLGLVRCVMQRPTTVIAMFLNSDCDPKFEESGRYGGMLEVLVDFLVEMAFVDFTSKDWITQEQAALLRRECLDITRAFAASLRRWVVEDPSTMARAEAECLATTGSALQPALAVAIPGAHSSSDLSESDADNAASASEIGGSCTAPSTGVRSECSTGARGQRALRRPGAFHWKHVHQLLCNKKILEGAIGRLNTNWRHGRKFLEDRGVIPPDDPLAFARFLREHPALEKAQLRGIFEKVLKDEEALRILEAYLSTFNFSGTPLDVALRDTTCEFMSWDAVNFEAPVWGRIQEVFGREYARQNSNAEPGTVCALTARDADALAGVCLFLHTSLHNRNVGADRMSLDNFISFGGPCLEQPLRGEDMRGIYERIAARKWAPPRKLLRVAAAVASGTDATRNRQSGPGVGASGGTGGSVTFGMRLSEKEAELLDGNMRTYTDHMQHFRISQQNQLMYLRVANEHLRVFEQELAAFYAKKAHRLPYIVPKFAQHVRPIVLLFYPHIISCAYVCLRLCSTETTLLLVDSIYELLFDVAAAFVIDLGDMYSAVERITQRCLRQENAVRLGNLAPSLSIFMMNRV